MCDALAERSLRGGHLVHVEFDEVPGKTGEVHDVGFGHGPAARGADVVYNKILKVQGQVQSPL
jgi:hypothetical protein